MKKEEIIRKVRSQLEGLRKAYPDCMFRYNDFQTGVSDEYLSELQGILKGDMAKLYPQLKIGEYYYKQYKEDRDGEDQPQSFSIFNVLGIYLNPDVEEDDDQRYIETALVYQLEGYSVCSSIRNCSLSIVPFRYLDTSGGCEQLEALISNSDYIINDFSGIGSGFETIIPTNKKNFKRIQEKLNNICIEECQKLKNLMEED